MDCSTIGGGAMKKLLNTLYVLSEDAYLSLDGETVVILRPEQPDSRFPLHTLENILCFSYKGASPALMGKCSRNGIGLSFFTPRGQFLTRCWGENNGNVLLRKEQYRRSDNPEESCLLARQMILGKVYNSRWVLLRGVRDHTLRLEVEPLQHSADLLKHSLQEIQTCPSLERLRGLEGDASSTYFGVLDSLILQNQETFFFRQRSRRPPKDAFNALLSFVYTLLANLCASALEGVGLDSYVGFLHRDRPGRASLALDLMEELRPLLGDRFVLTLINHRLIRPEHLSFRENGTVLLTDQGRKILLNAWQERLRETLTHPFLSEKLSWGLVPHIQAQLLARHLRGDLDAYPPFLWK